MNVKKGTYFVTQERRRWISRWKSTPRVRQWAVCRMGSGSWESVGHYQTEAAAIAEAERLNAWREQASNQ